MERTAIVRIHRPELTSEERAKQMKQIHDAAVQLVLSAARAKREKKEDKNENRS